MNLNRWTGKVMAVMLGFGASLMACAPGAETGVSMEALSTFTVNSQADGDDLNPGDGICAIRTANPSRTECTLRAALTEANVLPGPDLIVLGAGTYRVTLSGAPDDSGAMGDLDVLDDVEIVGAGPSLTAIVAASDERVFDVQPQNPAVPITVRIRDLAIEGGRDVDGGGLLNREGATTRLTNVAITGNVARRSGGGIYNAPLARLVMENVLVQGNAAGDDGGGVYNAASSVSYRGGIGAVPNFGIVEMTDVTIESNLGGNGTGGFVCGGVGTIRRTTFRGNEGAGRRRILSAGGVLVSGSALLENVTISDNTGEVGGLRVLGRAELTNVTIAYNTGGLANEDAFGAKTVVVNSIVADSEFGPGVNCLGSISTLGYNIDSGYDCGFNASSDQMNTDPLLAPLAFEMSSTPVHGLSSRSPALDAGDDARCPATDQRGVLRPQGAACDIGAYEASAVNFVVDTLLDGPDERPGDGVCRTSFEYCSLRAAIMEANARPGPDTVGFLVDGTFELTTVGAREDAGASGDLDVTESLTIRGNGAGVTEIHGIRRDRVFDFGASGERISASVTDLTVRGGETDDWGGGIRIGRRAALSLVGVWMKGNVAAAVMGSRNGGGGISNDGTLDMRDCTLFKNRADSAFGLGGGVLNNGVLRVVDTVFDRNTTNYRGGALFCGGSTSGATSRTTLRRVRIEGNSAADVGGAIALYGVLEGDDLALLSNAGGALWGHAASVARLSQSTFADNVGRLTAEGSAASMSAGSTFALTNATVSGNLGTSCALSVGTATLTNVTIADNDGGISGTGATLVNTIVAGSRSGPECLTRVTSRGHNLDSGMSCSFGALGDLRGVDPLLEPLAPNGGFAYTRALAYGSPAIDAGDSTTCPMADQRGILRSGRCDIGAFEFQ